MLIQHIAETRPGGLEGTTVEEVADLQKLYKESKARFDADEEFKGCAREAVTRLQSGDKQFEEVWPPPLIAILKLNTCAQASDFLYKFGVRAERVLEGLCSALQILCIKFL